MISKVFVRMTLVAATAILSTSSARAAILASDNFDSYAGAGALTGGSSGTGWGTNNWLAPNNPSTFATVNSYLGDNKVDVSTPNNVSSVVGGRLPGTPITQTFYASFAVSYFGTGANLFDANDTFGLVLSDLTAPSTTVSANVINFGLRGGAADAFGIRSATATGGSITGGALTPSTDYFLVAKLTFSGGLFGKGDLWVNPLPGLETAPNATLSLASGAGVAAINSVYFRQAANEAGDTYTFNNLILATDWNDIVPVPEPSTMALMALGGAACLALCRRGKRQV